MRNWKRQGVWVNVLNPYVLRRAPWDPTPALQATPPRLRRPKQPVPRDYPGKDHSESACEWGWVCGALEAGLEPQQVYQQLRQQALPRRQQDAQRYARYTLQRALRRYT